MSDAYSQPQVCYLLHSSCIQIKSHYIILESNSWLSCNLIGQPRFWSISGHKSLMLSRPDLLLVLMRWCGYARIVWHKAPSLSNRQKFCFIPMKRMVHKVFYRHIEGETAFLYTVSLIHHQTHKNIPINSAAHLSTVTWFQAPPDSYTSWYLPENVLVALVQHRIANI